MTIVDFGPSSLDPTPEQLEERDRLNWRDLLAAYEVEQRGVTERVGQLTSQLVALDQSITAATGHDQAALQINRVTIADRLDHAKARLPAIAEAITAHRKARP